eukprot:CAMPEP_0184969720 /NCGR_PEP_ID=MMETSP1098-20130426/2415_1 /TAXON_ID=89044 /ORGANISM="Spumella elongata, Strain CCAP 955/1" /LENGTH=231 /DNA_ID=CAMNT_0027491531 /DNA_START=29 /DNA_END=721 /DNA_ORIENTATION=-
MQNADILALAGLRLDGRRPSDIRSLKHNLSLVPTADGSAYLEQGFNKVLVMVHGPQEPKKRINDQNADKCNIVVRISHLPFCGAEWKQRRNGDKRTLEMEHNIGQIVEVIVMVDVYPKAEISIVVHVLEADGSVMCTIINALSLALMDAGVAMVDMISACSVGFVKNEFCLDVTQLEQNTGGAYIPIVIKARSDEIVFMQLDSRLSLDHLQKAMERGVEGCKLVKDYIEAV